MSRDDAPEVHPTSRTEWRAWLVEHHESGDGVWLVSFKKGTGKQQVSYEEAVEEALCFGWIDSTQKTIDAERNKLLFTPRRRSSGWARSNKERVQRLIEQGLMTPAGLRVVEQAKRDGSWALLDSIEDLKIPPDLSAALAELPGAEENFTGFSASARRAALWWIATARRPETRARRIAETARRAAEGRTVTP